MSQQNFPTGWNEDRARRLADYDDTLSEQDQAAEDEAAAREQAGQAVVTVPEELLPAIRQLLAGHPDAT